LIVSGDIKGRKRKDSREAAKARKRDIIAINHEFSPPLSVLSVLSVVKKFFVLSSRLRGFA
jgi:hypothetical protein